MKVREVIALAAANLGREDLISAAGSAASSASGELKTLLNCYNTVENEVALDYIPLKRTERLTVSDGKITYARFSRAPVCVYGVRTAEGQSLSFEKYPEYLEVGRRYGVAEVTYSCAPSTKAIGDDAEAGGKVSPRLLALGVTAEYCLVTGRFAEAELWESRFKDALRATASAHGSVRVRARRWE